MGLLGTKAQNTPQDETLAEMFKRKMREMAQTGAMGAKPQAAELLKQSGRKSIYEMSDEELRAQR